MSLISLCLMEGNPPFGQDFLKSEVYEKSACLVPIFKWSWNESTTFTC